MKLKTAVKFVQSENVTSIKTEKERQTSGPPEDLHSSAAKMSVFNHQECVHVCESETSLCGCMWWWCVTYGLSIWSGWSSLPKVPWKPLRAKRVALMLCCTPLTNSHIFWSQRVLFALWILIFISFLFVIYHHLLCWQTCSQRAGYSFMDNAIFHLEICFWSPDECKFTIYPALSSVWSPPTPLWLVETRLLCLHMLNDAVNYPVVYKDVWPAFCVDKNIKKLFTVK